MPGKIKGVGCLLRHFYVVKGFVNTKYPPFTCSHITSTAFLRCLGYLKELKRFIKHDIGDPGHFGVAGRDQVKQLGVSNKPRCQCVDNDIRSLLSL